MFWVYAVVEPGVHVYDTEPVAGLPKSWQVCAMAWVAAPVHCALSNADVSRESAFAAASSAKAATGKSILRGEGEGRVREGERATRARTPPPLRRVMSRSPLRPDCRCTPPRALAYCGAAREPTLERRPSAAWVGVTLL